MEKHFFKRLSRLFDVRRFVAAWILLLVLLVGIVGFQLTALVGYYQQLQPAPGGTYSEGMIGSFTNANPIYATDLVDTTVSRLIFAGLLKYDANNKLVGDLAESWKISDDGRSYTVILRPNLKWHDGQDLTSDDVVYTFQTIQNPDAKSPLFHAWRGISIKATDARTVEFTLPFSLAPFVHSLVTGIVPKHSLKTVQAAQLRSASFNTLGPIGAGPYKWETVEVITGSSTIKRHHIGLTAFTQYHSGVAKIQQFIVKTYANEDELINSFQKQEVNGLVGLDRLPDALAQDNNIQEYSIPLTAETVVFLRTDSEMLKDVRVRQALVKAIDGPAIVKGLAYPAIVADEPLLRGQVGYNAALRQFPTNVQEAGALLDAAGWTLKPNEQIRSNGPVKLSLNFIAHNNPDYAYVTQQLQKAWQAIGVGVQVTLPSDDELRGLISGREYDALLYGISIGSDPDVFAYWHSSQTDLLSVSRLNLSNYKSTVADNALEGGRTRLDPNLRAVKYIPFLQAWHDEVPAIALYQPRFLYITHGQVFGFDPKVINSASERFNNVENWMIRQNYQLKSQ